MIAPSVAMYSLEGGLTLPPFLLLLIGGAISLYSLWQFRRWLTAGQEGVAAGSRRLEGLVDELVATAEATVSAVEEKAEALTDVIARADEKLARLEAATVAPPAPAPAQPAAAVAPAPAADADLPELHRLIYGLADAGKDVTGIARQLHITKGEVELILGLRQTG